MTVFRRAIADKFEAVVVAPKVSDEKPQICEL